MDKKHIEGILRSVQHKTEEKISQGIDHDSIYSGGLSREGFLGGYEAAIQQVRLFLQGVHPGATTQLGYRLWDQISQENIDHAIQD